ncbi:hypothetical protein ACFL2U_02845 [Patescibacteria group bacterium]
MPENFKEIPPLTPEQKFEQESSAERIKEIEEEIQELEEAKQEAVDSIQLISKKKKKGKNPDMQKIELPDNPDTREAGFVKDEKGNFHFEFTDSNGNIVIASPGDLVSDMQWGIYYDLNHEIKSSDHRSKYDKFRKKYLAAAYQTKIDRLSKEKELLEGLQNPTLQTDIRDIYIDIYNEMKTETPEDEMQAGFIFEKMISGLLTKISIDLGDDFHFGVTQASVKDDVMYKADVIVKFIKSERGDRGVVARENKDVDKTVNKGYQLTLIDQQSDEWKRKKRQVDRIKEMIMRGEIDKIEDLVLLETAVNNKDVMSRFDQWLKRGKFAGGPENLFPQQRIIMFLTKIFENTDLDLNKNPEFAKALDKYFE